MPRKKKRSLTINSKETRVFLGVVIFLLGFAVAAAPFFPDAELLQYFTQLFGKASVFWGIAIILTSLRIMTSFEYLKSNIRLLGFYIGAITASAFFSFWVPAGQATNIVINEQYGGAIGMYLNNILNNSVGRFIEFLILFILILISFSLISGTSLEKIANLFESIIKILAKPFNREKKEEEIDIIEGSNETPAKSYIGGDDTEQTIINGVEEDDEPINDNETDNNTIQLNNSDINTIDNTNTSESSTLTNQENMYPDWQFPPLDLLAEPVVQKQDQEIHKRNAILIEKTLQSFDIESKVTKITIGPTVVQYALTIAVGTKVTKIKNHTGDLALSLATSESQIRIEAPIPGTSLIGIEIPNPTPNFVYIREIIREMRENKDKFHLPLALGKDVSGKIYMKDLVEMPHLLVAGATGTGKSVGINSILTGLLMTKTPDELRLILVDPKMVELAPYNDLPHLLTPVITDMELVVNALQWAIEEMLTRYRMLKQVGVKNIAEYNKKFPDAKIPYIVIIVDEMSDLMQTTGADVDSKILRLAQMARAIGIHLILATQRPDVNVITGVIKANVNGRMAFSVSTQVDSRVIMDQSGAETLIGKGDMLFKSPDKTKPVRLQGAFTQTEDTDRLVKYLIDQKKSDVENHLSEVVNPEPTIGSNGEVSGLGKLSDDEFFEQAVEQVIVSQKGSSSMLQRKFSIGYNRAARLIDEMEELGVVGPQLGSNPRQVLVKTKEEFIQKLKSGNNSGSSETESFDE